MSDDVDLSFSADDRDTDRVWGKQEKHVDKLMQKFNKLFQATMQQNKASIQASHQAVQGWAQQSQLLTRLIVQLGQVHRQTAGIGANLNKIQSGGLPGLMRLPLRQMAGVAGGYLSVQSLFSHIIGSGRRHAEEGAEASKMWDLINREFQGQAELRGLPAKRAERGIFQVAQGLGLPIEDTTRAATQLVSSEFDPALASGEGLREMLKGMVGANLAGKEVDFEAMAKSVAAYMFAQGLNKNDPMQIRRLMANIQTLYKDTTLEFQDFAEFSKESAVMRGKLSQEEQLATLSGLKGLTGSGEEASTHMRNIVLRTATAAGSKEKEDGLQMLGLKPGDVDLIGEDFLTVLRRYKQALDRTPDIIDPIALKKIFEERAVTSAQFLFDNVDWISGKMEKLGEVSMDRYEKDVKFASQGINAANRRQENERKQHMAASGEDWNELMIKEANTHMLKRGWAPWIADASTGLTRMTRYMTGAPAESVLPFTLPDMSIRANQREAEIVRQRAMGKMQGREETVEQIEKRMDLPPQPTANMRGMRKGDFKIGGFNVTSAINELGGDLRPGQLSRRFSNDELGGIYSQWNWKRNPSGAFGQTDMNPFWNRDQKFPQEVSVSRDLRRVGDEMNARADLFGGVPEQDASGMRSQLSEIHQKLSSMPAGVGSYELQQLLDKLVLALDRNSEATEKNSRGQTPGQAAVAGVGGAVKPTYRAVSEGLTRQRPGAL